MQVPFAASVGSRLTPSNCVLLICDIQERFIPLIYRSSTVVNTCRYMTSVAATLQIPMICTQQYTKAFGNTVNECFASPEIRTLATSPIYEKKKFSMLTEEVNDKIANIHRDTYILLGIEAHVCLQQTCLDLRERDKTVYIILDGISSQQSYDRSIAIQRMINVGAIVTTAQSATFELMNSAEHEHFKTISKLTVEHMKLPNEFNDNHANTNTNNTAETLS